MPPTLSTLQSAESWALVQQMIGNATQVVAEDAETDQELLEGMRAVARTLGLCTQLSVEADPLQPRFFDMCSPTRMVGGPNPDGNYYLAMIRGDRRYRISGVRGTSAYLGFQILAGTGLTPRRMAGYVNDTQLRSESGEFTLLLSAQEPTDCAGARWVQIPDDASSIVVREYVGDFSTEDLATLHIEDLDAAEPTPLTDVELSEQLVSMGWTLLKLMTLHRTIKPELLENPNTLITAEAADLGAADTTPDNLYMIGTFRLEPDEALVLEIDPPHTAYWNVTLENVWHECLEPRSRHSSVTNRALTTDGDGKIRIAISEKDFGLGHWLDTGGRHRGFVLLRWLHHPMPPTVVASVRRAEGV